MTRVTEDGVGGTGSCDQGCWWMLEGMILSPIKSTTQDWSENEITTTAKRKCGWKTWLVSNMGQSTENDVK